MAFLRVMTLRIRKILLTLVISAGLAGFCLLYLPLLMERSLARKFRIETWRSAFGKEVAANTNVHISIQGAQIDLLRGLILKGIRIQNKQKLYLLRAEEAVLKFSLLALFSKNPSFTAFKLDKAKLTLTSYKTAILQKIRSDWGSIAKRIAMSTLHDGLPLELSKLHITSFKKQKAPLLQKSFHANVKLWPVLAHEASNKQIMPAAASDSAHHNHARPAAYKSRVLIQAFQTSQKKNKETQAEDWRLIIETDRDGASRLSFHAVPFQIISSLLHYCHRACQSEEIFPIFQIIHNASSGLFHGEAVLTSKRLAYAQEFQIKLDLNYEKLSAHIQSALLPDIQIEKADGKLAFQAVNARQGQTKTKNLSFHFYLKQRDIELSLAKRKEKAPIDLLKTKFSERLQMPALHTDRFLYKIKVKCFLHPKKSAVSLASLQGDFHLDVTLLHSKNRFYPEGTLSVQDLSLPSLSLGDDSLFFQKIQLSMRRQSQKGGGTKGRPLASLLSFQALGHYLQSKLNLKGNGTLLLDTKPKQRRWPIIQFQPVLQMQAKWEGLKLTHALRKIQFISKSIFQKGTKIRIPHGLEVKRGEFLKTRLYQSLLSALDLRAHIELSKIEAAPPFPKQLRFLLKVTRDDLRLALERQKTKIRYNAENVALGSPGIEREDQGRLSLLGGGHADVEDGAYVDVKFEEKHFHAQFQYSLHFHDTLPRHDLDLNLSVKGNENALEFLTGTKEPPHDIDLVYRYDGKGLSASDLIRKSYSYFKLEAQDALLANKETLKTLAHAGGIQEKSLSLANMLLQRRSSGIHTRLYFSGKSDSLYISGKGDYDVGLGGKLKYAVRVRQAKAAQARKYKQATVRILASGKWIPDI